MGDEIRRKLPGEQYERAGAEDVAIFDGGHLGHQGGMVVGEHQGAGVGRVHLTAHAGVARAQVTGGVVGRQHLGGGVFLLADSAEAEAAALPPLPSGDFRIASVDLGTAVDGEGRVAEAKTQFAPGDTIRAAVIGVGSSDGLTLSARWLAPDGREIAKAGQTLTPSAPTVATFTLAQPQPWPVGTYSLEVAINDRVVETRSFEVR